MRSSLLCSLLLVSLLVPIAARPQTPKPLVENDRVRVTRVDVAVGETLSPGGEYEAVAVQLQDGETSLLDPGQFPKVSPTRAGDSHFFVAGSRRSIKNIGNRPLSFVVIRLLRPAGKYVAFEVPPSHYCEPGQKKACVTERYLYCTDSFCAESVDLEPGAASTQHTHDADYLIVATSNFTWRNEPVGKPAGQESFVVGDVHYIDAGGSHRLVNTGTTPANLFVIQFK
jgi:quercetin dioxygenase-like cupin family protein